jgi:hypothetical protein
MVLHSSLRQHFSTNCGGPNSNHFKTSLRFGLSFAQSIPCWPKHALSNAVYPTPNEKAIMGVDLYNRTRKILNEQSVHNTLRQRPCLSTSPPQRAMPCSAPRDDHTWPAVPPHLYSRPALIGVLGQECTATFLLRFQEPLKGLTALLWGHCPTPYGLMPLTLVSVVLRPWRAESPGGSSTAPRPSAHACSPPLPLSGFCHGARLVAESPGFVGPFYAPPSGSWSAPHAPGAGAESCHRVC